MNNLSSNQNPTSSLKLTTSGNLISLVQTEEGGSTVEASSSKMNGAALLHGIREGDLDRVEELLNEGADVNAKDAEGWTALMLATVKGHLEAVRTLLHGGADVNARNSKGWTALRLAVSLNDTEITRLLLDGGANINDKDDEGNTALMQAAGEKSMESLHLLLAYEAETGLRNHAGETALTIAERRGYSEAVRWLKDAGAVSEGGHHTEDEDELFSAGEMKRLMEEIDGLVPPAASGNLPEVQSLVPITTAPPDVLARLANALEALRPAKQAASPHISIAEIAHKLMLSVPEAAALSGLSQTHLRQTIKDGGINARKAGQGWRIKRNDLEAYVNSF